MQTRHPLQAEALWLGRVRPAAAPVVQELRAAGVRLDVWSVDTWLEVLPGSTRPAPAVVILDLTDSRAVAAARRRRSTDGGSRSGLGPVLALVREQHLRWPELPSLIDDFLLPPYRPGEALTRLELLVRRQALPSDRVIRVGELEVDIVERQVRLNGVEVALTPREHDLLAYLAVHRGRTFTRQVLLEHVWGRSYEGGPRTVDIHIRRLREKLPAPHDNCLETIRHVGYRLREPRSRAA